MGVCETIRVGDDLQENIILVKDVGEDGVTSVISHDLCNRTHGYMCPVQICFYSMLYLPINNFTFLANQIALAWVTHSLEWMPVSIQIPGRFAPVLN